MYFFSFATQQRTTLEHRAAVSLRVAATVRMPQHLKVQAEVRTTEVQVEMVVRWTEEEVVIMEVATQVLLQICPPAHRGFLMVSLKFVLSGHFNHLIFSQEWAALSPHLLLPWVPLPCHPPATDSPIAPRLSVLPSKSNFNCLRKNVHKESVVASNK